jgi:hypothetical protein
MQRENIDRSPFPDVVASSVRTESSHFLNWIPVDGVAQDSPHPSINATREIIT